MQNASPSAVHPASHDSTAFPSQPVVVATVPAGPDISSAQGPHATRDETAAPARSSAPLPPADVKVLHVVNGEHFSGAERVQSHLGRCLPRFGVRADFACVKPGRFSQLLRERQSNAPSEFCGHESCRHESWGLGFETPMSHRMDLRAAFAVRDLVRQHGYDLLHAHTPRTAMIAAVAARLTATPWVYHVHSPASRDSQRWLNNHVNAWIERVALSSCAHRITVSESLRKECLRGGVPPESVTVVHNGVPGIRPSRQSIPVPGGRWTIGMVALMRPRKGLEIVLDALAMLRQRGHDVLLRCIGPFETADYETEIESRIVNLGLQASVERQGFTQDVPAALAKLDAMVLPSLYGEGLPMVVLEAMAAGLPVVATAVEGTPEAIRHGVEGLLARPRDPESLADALGSLIRGDHDWCRLSEAAISRHAEAFSDLAMARRTADVYRQLLGK